MSSYTSGKYYKYTPFKRDSKDARNNNNRDNTHIYIYIITAAVWLPDPWYILLYPKRVDCSHTSANSRTVCLTADRDYITHFSVFPASIDFSSFHVLGHKPGGASGFFGGQRQWRRIVNRSAFAVNMYAGQGKK